MLRRLLAGRHRKDEREMQQKRAHDNLMVDSFIIKWYQDYSYNNTTLLVLPGLMPKFEDQLGAELNPSLNCILSSPMCTHPGDP